MLLLSPGEVMALNRAQLNDVRWGQTAAPGSGSERDIGAALTGPGVERGIPNGGFMNAFRNAKPSPCCRGAAAAAARRRAVQGASCTRRRFASGCRASVPPRGCRDGGAHAGWDPSAVRGHPRPGYRRGWRSGGGEVAMSLESRDDTDLLGQLKLFPASP